MLWVQPCLIVHFHFHAAQRRKAAAARSRKAYAKHAEANRRRKRQQYARDKAKIKQKKREHYAAGAKSAAAPRIADQLARDRFLILPLTAETSRCVEELKHGGLKTFVSTAFEDSGRSIFNGKTGDDGRRIQATGRTGLLAAAILPLNPAESSCL